MHPRGEVHVDKDDDEDNDLMMKSNGMRYYDSMINELELDIWL